MHEHKVHMIPCPQDPNIISSIAFLIDSEPYKTDTLSGVLKRLLYIWQFSNNTLYQPETTMSSGLYYHISLRALSPKADSGVEG